MRVFFLFFVVYLSSLSAYQFFPEDIPQKQLKNGLSYAVVSESDSKVELCIPFLNSSKLEAEKIGRDFARQLQNMACAEEVQLDITDESIIYRINLPNITSNRLSAVLRVLSNVFEMDNLTIQVASMESYRRMYHPKNAALIIRGNLEHDSLEGLISQYFELPFVAEKQEAIKRNLDEELFLTTMIPSKGASEEINSENTKPFYGLFISEKDKKNVDKLIKRLAHRNVIELLWHKKEMEKLGDKIEHLHPMRFIGYIYSRHDLKKAMKTVHDSSFKWNAFVDGFSGGMEKESRRSNLIRHVPGFCKETHADINAITDLIHKRDWEGILKYYL